jgi:uncharacterized membrane protein YkvA (DUF1232 family)
MTVRRELADAPSETPATASAGTPPSAARPAHAALSAHAALPTPDGALPAPRAAASGEAPGDLFPRERFVALVAHLPRYLRLALRLAGEPRLSRSRKAGVLAAAAYLASPIDAIPGVIPVVGQLDDLAVALFALRAALRSLDPEVRAAQLAAVGLTPDDLDHDLGTLAVAAGWLARRGYAVGRRLAILAATASLAAARAGADGVRRGAPIAGRAGGQAIRTAGGVMARVAGRGRVLVAGRIARHRATGDDGAQDLLPVADDGGAG